MYSAVSSDDIRVRRAGAADRRPLNLNRLAEDAGREADFVTLGICRRARRMVSAVTAANRARAGARQLRCCRIFAFETRKKVARVSPGEFPFILNQ